MHLLEVGRILKSAARHWTNPADNPLSIREMAFLYIQRKIYLRRHPLPAIRIPFAFAIKETSPPPRIAVIVHCYYPELMPEMLTHIRQIPLAFQLYVSTDTEEKKKELIHLINEHHIPNAEVRTVPNRGRDIAPKYIAFRDVYENCDYFLHLHSKKSTALGPWGDEWRRYLLQALAGSAEIVRSNLRLLSDERVGLVFPVPLNDTAPFLRWGTNFNAASDLAHRLGINIDTEYCYDYPDGSMYWGKPAAIKPLLDINLSFEDFPVEKGQLDGGLNHAIERMVAYCSRRQGLSTCRVSTSSQPARLKIVRDESALAAAVSDCLAAQEEERVRCQKSS